MLAPKIKEHNSACDAAGAALAEVQKLVAEIDPLVSRAEQMTNATQQLAQLRAELAKTEAEWKKLGGGQGKSLSELRAQMAQVQKDNLAANKTLAEKRKVLETGRKTIADKEKAIAGLMEKLVACDSSAESTAVLQERLMQVRLSVSCTCVFLYAPFFSVEPNVVLDSCVEGICGFQLEACPTETRQGRRGS